MLITAIAQAELRSVEDLARFFALDKRLVENLINRLRAIGHIDLTSEPLNLTELGLYSLQEQRSYSRLLTRHALYFDAVLCQPLLRSHYRLQIYTMDEVEKLRGFEQIAYGFLHWDDTALERLKARSDYHVYNLPDEIKIATLQLTRRVDRFSDVVYLPVYAVERHPGGRDNLPPILAFSRVQGDRDVILEAGLNNNDALGDIFREDFLVDLEEVVTKDLQDRGHAKDEWVFVPYGPRGPEIQLKTPRAIVEKQEEGKPKPLSLLKIGRYLGVRTRFDTYCVWVTCQKPEERRKAVSERTVSWLEQSRFSRSRQVIVDWVARRSQELNIAPPTLDDIYQTAKARNAWNVIERLEVLGDLS